MRSPDPVHLFWNMVILGIVAMFCLVPPAPPLPRRPKDATVH